jgi:cathepsin L
MKVAAFLAVGLCVAVMAAAVENTYSRDRVGFNQWTSVHGKEYVNEALENARYAAWKSNYDLVVKHNEKFDKGLSTFHLGMTQFADLSNEEYRTTMLGSKFTPSGRRGATSTFVANKDTSVPTNWSWVEKGVVTSVKNQGNCGSCWAFSATAAMEAAYNLKNLNKIPSGCTSKCGKQNVTCCSFSNQEVADCTRGGADTCNIGGEPHDGILEIVNDQKGRINTDSDYPYTSGKTGQLSKCSPVSSSAIATGITGYSNVTHGDETALTQAAYAYPTISVGIDAGSFAFQLYQGGVYDDDTCKNKITDLNHGVAVVGFGVGSPKPPGPPGPKPGPANCENNHYKPACLGEKGCFWCTDPHIGWCQNVACSSPSFLTDAKKPQPTAEYYLVKNSWGNDWGMNGYIAMSRNKNNQCGIATDAVFALI